MKTWNARFALMALVACTGLLLSMTPNLSAEGQTQTVTQRDKLKISVQRICPVSGRKLGSMGTPIKKRIGDEDLFLCCSGCTKGKVSREHWETIHTNLKMAQAKCPVMGKDLPVKSKWTVVQGQIVYVCCPPCIEKIQADPNTWLAKLDQLYAASTAGSDRDQLKIAAQQICPVSGRKLGSMGAPIKTKIGKEELFLCCKACAKGKISRKFWGTIHANFLKAQGTCPVMEKPLPANPKWTVVDGQIIYVCCPPCTKKIEADPKTYLTKVAALYQSVGKGPQ